MTAEQPLAPDVSGGPARGPLAVAVACLMAQSAWALGPFEKNHPLVEKGLSAYDRKDYEQALKDFDDARKELPSSAPLEFNRGNALYKLGRLEEAQQAYHRVANTERSDLKEKDYYNLGNSWAEMGNTQEAITAYRKALLLNPKDEDARHNLEVVLRKLAPPRSPIPDGGTPGQDGGSDGGPADGGGSDGGRRDGGGGDSGTPSASGSGAGDGGRDGGSSGPQNEGGDAGQTGPKEPNRAPGADAGRPHDENPRRDGGIDAGNEDSTQIVLDGGMGELKLNKDEIERLLDSVKQNEKSLQLWRFQQKRARKQNEKDW
jgi:tetratricopeptide (TPR) repeat protein